MNAIFRWLTLVLATAAVATGLYLNYQWLQETRRGNVIELMFGREQPRQAAFDNCARMLELWPRSEDRIFGSPSEYRAFWEKCDDLRLAAQKAP